MRPLIPPPYSSTLYKNKTPYGYNTVHYSIYGRITAVRQPRCRYLTVSTSLSPGWRSTQLNSTNAFGGLILKLVSTNAVEWINRPAILSGIEIELIWLKLYIAPIASSPEHVAHSLSIFEMLLHILPTVPRNSHHGIL